MLLKTFRRVSHHSSSVSRTTARCHAAISHQPCSHAELYHLTRPSPDIPILVNSPHSGTRVPPSFKSSLSRAKLTETEDSYVDELWLKGCKEAGTGLMAATFPRWFVDLNRREDDIDPSLLLPDSSSTEDGLVINPGSKTKLGLGLIRRLAGPGIPIYDQLLSKEEVMHRIKNYFRPYHLALTHELELLHKMHGRYVLIDAHSMKSMGNSTTPDGARARPDVVVGDLRGKSCDAWLTESLVKSLRSQGLSVQVNDPYAGAHIMREYGRPIEQRHSIQIELSRRLYMNEESRVIKKADFEKLSDILAHCLRGLVGWNLS